MKNKMKKVRIEQEVDDRYWIVIESEDEHGVAHAVFLDEIELIGYACRKFIKERNK